MNIVLREGAKICIHLTFATGHVGLFIFLIGVPRLALSNRMLKDVYCICRDISALSRTREGL